MNLESVKILSVKWENESCVFLDQTRLPHETLYQKCSSVKQVVEAIRNLVVRGAPAIGIAGAYGYVLAAMEVKQSGLEKFQEPLDLLAAEILSSRPTAVNLEWAISRMRKKAQTFSRLDQKTIDELLDEAKKIHEEDLQNNLSMAQWGVSCLDTSSPVEVMTYCNTGDLATGGVGTALGVIKRGYLEKKISHVYVCETRPLGQGLRLTAWELSQHEIPQTVICDNMIGSLMRQKKIGAVFVGADRVTQRGDFANKIGTYSLAILANVHGVPFYVVAPTSSYDSTLVSGSDITIEQRSGNEVVKGWGGQIPSVNYWNPAFDVTPAELVTAWISEKGVQWKENKAVSQTSELR
jgi:methylthioribose-1-phosphate isomerase